MRISGTPSMTLRVRSKRQVIQFNNVIQKAMVPTASTPPVREVSPG